MTPYKPLQRTGTWRVLVLVAATLLLTLRAWQAGGLLPLFVSPDQRAQLAFQQGAWQKAGGLFTDPVRRGVAWYRGGAFEEAAAAFAESDQPEAHFNRGDALIFLGRYDEAVAAFERALQQRPDWSEARDNLRLARARAALLEPQAGDMTGGKLKADKIVFDNKPKQTGAGQEDAAEGGQQLDDQSLQALWLRRVQTSNADFLRARFSLQLAQQEDATGDEP